MASGRMGKRSSWPNTCRTAGHVLVDALTFLLLGFRSRSRLAAENLFLRKQLALYEERRVKPHRANDATRITLVLLARLMDWKAALTIVKPETLLRWHRQGYRLFRRWTSRVRGARDCMSIYRSGLWPWLAQMRRGARSGLPPNCS